MTDSDVLEALEIPRQGRVFDLSSGWWRGMPGAAPHPRFEVITYRTPRGQRNQQDIAILRADENRVNMGFISEFVLGTTHTGTHIDALCHTTCGETNTWHGGGSADQLLGDFGPLEHDASTLDPIVARGVMLDIPALRGFGTLPAATPVDGADLQAACGRQQIDVRAGDVVLVRTGQMHFWPDETALAENYGAGLSLDGARWLSARKVRAVGSDTDCIEVQPSGIAGDPQPVHVHLIRDHGIHIIEWVFCEELASAEISQFLFVALPLPIQGATGSMLRPLAIT
jgi:kynurenine formamidase